MSNPVVRSTRFSGPQSARRPATGPASAGTSALTRGLFAVYLALLIWIVVWKLHAPYLGDAAVREIKLIPFVPSGGAGSNAPFEVAGNFAIFVPFGVYLGLLRPTWPWWRAAFAITTASAVMEIAQYALAVGKTDLTDVIVNTAGGMAGLGLLAVTRAALRARTAPVMVFVLSIATALVLLACVSVVTAPPRDLAPRDSQVGGFELESP